MKRVEYKTSDTWVCLDRPAPDFWYWVLDSETVKIVDDKHNLIVEGPTALDCIRQLEEKGLLLGDAEETR